ncbi:hypothetical protein [Bacillus solitudinis]|uniref:hypothetical protein n=1 Tax=Bacillus solitudinis TaxID=2014074 RepID=UPI000C23C7BB|nr:hypothetical protein [Bacillus solitudinis]
MINLRRQMMVMLFLSSSLLLVLSACGSSANEKPEEISLITEQGEEVSLTNKERATVLFHFTEVG